MIFIAADCPLEGAFRECLAKAQINFHIPLKNKIIPYNPKLKEYARQMRKNSTLAEVLLWQKIKNRALGVQFHRQVPMLEYIVDFYCHEIQLAIEIDGDSHEYRYVYDSQRQGELEKRGVQFLRFSDQEVKKNMFSVELALEEKVREMLEIFVTKKTSLSPFSGGEFLKRQSHNADPTPPYPPQGGNRFPKKEKLKSRKLFGLLFAKGKSIKVGNLKLLYLQTALPEEVPFQTGVAVPKKNFKSAVKRNRIKRLLREGYRLNKHLIFNNSKGNFAFLFLYLGKEMPDYEQIERNIKVLLQKFLKEAKNEKTD